MADYVRAAVVRKNMLVVPGDEGETLTIAGTNSSTRFIADKSVAPFALIHSRCMPDNPVLPHLHREAIDTWLVLQGRVNVWAGSEGRVLGSGDFAFVPPGVTHSFAPLDPHTEFLGLIHPSQWIDFFKAIGEPFDGPGPFPSDDAREFPKDKMMKALKDGHDVVPQFGFKLGEVKSEWKDDEVPTESKPYFLKAHLGPRYALGAQTLEPLVLPSATGGKFAISLLESSTRLQQPAALAKAKYSETCLVVYCHSGKWTLEVEGEGQVLLVAGDSAYVPTGAEHELKPAAPFARAYLFTDGGVGPEELFLKSGKLIKGVLGSDIPEFDAEAVKAVVAQTEGRIVLAQL